MLDRIDKAIVRILLKYIGKYLTTYQLATKVKIAPLTAKRHLEKLKGEGYVESKLQGGIREYKIENGKNKSS